MLLLDDAASVVEWRCTAFGRNGGISRTAYGLLKDAVAVRLDEVELRRSFEEGGGEALGESGNDAVAVVAMLNQVSGIEI